MTDNSFQDGFRRKPSQGTMAEDTQYQTKDSNRKSKRQLIVNPYTKEKAYISAKKKGHTQS